MRVVFEREAKVTTVVRDVDGLAHAAQYHGFDLGVVGAFGAAGEQFGELLLGGAFCSALPADAAFAEEVDEAGKAFFAGVVVDAVEGGGFLFAIRSMRLPVFFICIVTISYTVV